MLYMSTLNPKPLSFYVEPACIIVLNVKHSSVKAVNFSKIEFQCLGDMTETSQRQCWTRVMVSMSNLCLPVTI